MTVRPSAPRRAGPVILAASLPMFTVSLNNLVVTNALPAIGRRFDTDVAGLQWVVNGYILAFAGFLLTGAALGDRYGRRRVFAVSIALFTLGSIAGALSPSVGFLVAARVVQGMGAAAVLPLSLTLVAGAVPDGKRSAVVGLWGGVNGLGVALGPMVGGAITGGIAWEWIFWVNVPIGVLCLPLLRVLPESKGRDPGLDLPGMLLATSAVTAAVWGIVKAPDLGWTSWPVLLALLGAGGLAVGFVRWEHRTPTPLLPMRFYRIRPFVLSNLVALAMFFGVFGSIFFLVQFMQGPMGFEPFAAGVRTLPWTAMPMVVAPIAGLVADRAGPHRLMAAGMALQAGALAWLASIATIDLQYVRMVPALVMAGVGMGLMLAPMTALVLNSVAPHEHGKASGANTTIRELGGALGVAVLTTVFQSRFSGVSLLSPVDIAHAFVHGMATAMWVGTVVVAAGAVAAALIPGRSRRPAGDPPEERPADEGAPPHPARTPSSS